MALPAKIKQFAEAIDLTRCRVLRPLPFIFLCGGKLRTANEGIKSVRESLLQTKSKRDRFSDDVRIILAETVSSSFDARVFDDLMEMETFVASASEAVVLILEGPGAIAELGAFSQNPDISDRLFSVVRHGRHPAKSFISDGPLRQLLNHKGEIAVGSYKWIDEEYNFAEKRAYEFSVPPESLKSIDSDVTSYINRRAKRRFLGTDSIGGRLCLIAGLIQMCRGLKIDEVKSIARIAGISSTGRFIEKALFALSEIGWIKEEQIQHDRYWIATFHNKCIDLAYFSGKLNDTDRWLRIITDSLKHKNDNRLHLMRTADDKEFKLDI